MIPRNSDPFQSFPKTLDTSRLEQATKPMHGVLADLIASCSSDTTVSTVTTAALTLSLWQLRGGRISDHLPSMVILNAREAPSDPVDSFVRSFIHDEENCGPGQAGQRSGIPIKANQALGVMQQSMRERRDLGYEAFQDPFSKRNARIHEENYWQAVKTRHGTGWARAYSRAWDLSTGLLTCPGDHLHLRVNKPADRDAFRRDVLEAPQRLLVPEGMRRNLLPVTKTISLSGSLTADLWDEELVMGIIRLGLPVVFLPHLATEPLHLPNAPALKLLPDTWQNISAPRAKTPLPLPPIDWFETHSDDLRRRLHHLPGPGTYEFAILQLLRQLGSVCDQIAQFAGNNPEAAPEQISALFWDLNTRTFRSVTLGVASLAWHGLGFDPGCPRERAMKVLRHIRGKGTVRKRDLLLAKGARVDATTRDLLLERLAAEDLIRVDGKTITAVAFEEFVKALHSRPQLPDVENFRGILKRKQSAPDREMPG